MTPPARPGGVSAVQPWARGGTFRTVLVQSGLETNPCASLRARHAAATGARVNLEEETGVRGIRGVQVHFDEGKKQPSDMLVLACAPLSFK